MPSRVGPEALRDAEPQELEAFDSLVAAIQAGHAAGDPIGRWDVLAAFRFIREANPDNADQILQCEVDVLIHVPGRGVVVMDFTSKRLRDMGATAEQRVAWLTSSAPGRLGKFPTNMRQAQILSKLTSTDAFRRNASLPLRIPLPLLPFVAFQKVDRPSLQALLGAGAPELRNAVCSDIWQIPNETTRAARLRAAIEDCFDANGGNFPTRGDPWPDDQVNSWWTSIESGTGFVTGSRKGGLRTLVEGALVGSDSESTVSSKALWSQVEGAAADLPGPGDRRGVAVSGLAGTGKSWLGMYGALRRIGAASRGGGRARVLFLCFSARLRTQLDERIRHDILDTLQSLGRDTSSLAVEARDDLRFATPEELAPLTTARYADDPAHANRRYLNLEEYWLEAIDEASSDRRYDLVIVDEAQDFNELRGVNADDVYYCIESLLADGGLLVILGDPSQRSRRNQESLPWRPPARYPNAVTLTQNFRSIESVVAWIESVARPGYDMDELGATPGIAVTCAEVLPGARAPDEVVRAVGAALQGLKGSLGRILPADTVVLCNEPAWVPVIAAAMDSSDQWPAGCRTVPVLAIDDFKGLEATFVVLVIGTWMPDGTSRRLSDAQCETALYVGASRSRAWLTVIHDGTVLPG